VVNTARTSPARFALRLTAGYSWPASASRLFVNGGYDVPLEANATEAILEDWLGAAESVVYEIGCDGPAAWAKFPAHADPLTSRPSTQVVEVLAWQSCSNRRIHCVDSMWGC
jgi:hypothetical protein